MPPIGRLVRHPERSTPAKRACGVEGPLCCDESRAISATIYNHLASKPLPMTTKSRKNPLLVALIVPFFAALAVASDTKPLLTLDEFFNAVDFTRVQLSPDGHMVVIATSRADWKAQRFREDLWLWRD